MSENKVTNLIVGGIYSWVGNKCEGKDFYAVNEWMKQCQVHLLKTDIILAIITSTFDYKDELDYRPRLFKKCQIVLTNRKEPADELLEELE